eukprot:UN07670
MTIWIALFVLFGHTSTLEPCLSDTIKAKYRSELLLSSMNRCGPSTYIEICAIRPWRLTKHALPCSELAKCPTCLLRVVSLVFI